MKLLVWNWRESRITCNVGNKIKGEELNIDYAVSLLFSPIVPVLFSIGTFVLFSSFPLSLVVLNSIYPAIKTDKRTRMRRDVWFKFSYQTVYNIN